MDIYSFYSSQQELLQQQAEPGMLWECTNKGKTAHWPLHWDMHGDEQSTFPKGGERKLARCRCTVVLADLLCSSMTNKDPHHMHTDFLLGCNLEASSFLVKAYYLCLRK